MEYHWGQKATYWPRQLQRESGRGHFVCLQGLELKITFEILTPPLSLLSHLLSHSILVFLVFAFFAFSFNQFLSINIYMLILTPYF